MLQTWNVQHRKAVVFSVLPFPNFGQPFKKQAIAMWFVKGFDVFLLLNPQENKKYFNAIWRSKISFSAKEIFLKPFQVHCSQENIKSLLTSAFLWCPDILKAH